MRRVLRWLRDRLAKQRDQRDWQNLQRPLQPGPNVLGPIGEWPWGQRPADYMIDPSGHVAGPLSDPKGWIAAHRSNIEYREVK